VQVKCLAITHEALLQTKNNFSVNEWGLILLPTIFKSHIE